MTTHQPLTNIYHWTELRTKFSYNGGKTLKTFAYHLISAMFRSHITMPISLLLRILYLSSLTEYHTDATNALSWWIPIEPSVYLKVLHLIYGHQVEHRYPVVPQ